MRKKRYPVRCYACDKVIYYSDTPVVTLEIKICEECAKEIYKKTY